MSTNLAKREEGAALVRLDPQTLLQSAVENGAGIETLERLVALAKDVRAEQARSAWYDAMAEFQRRCPAITKTETARIQTTRGSYAYRYAPLDEILRVVQPIMGELGLSIRWREEQDDRNVACTCVISHALGHSEDSGTVRMPVDNANPEKGANPAQRVAIAKTYAKRYALWAAIGKHAEDDPDAEEEPREPTVQPPRRASESKASPAESPGEGASLVYEGPVLGVKVAKEGKQKDGTPWTLYAITGEEWEGVTFSSTVADMARSLVGNGVETKITYHVERAKSGRDSNKIDEIEDPVPL